MRNGFNTVKTCAAFRKPNTPAQSSWWWSTAAFPATVPTTTDWRKAAGDLLGARLRDGGTSLATAILPYRRRRYYCTCVCARARDISVEFYSGNTSAGGNRQKKKSHSECRLHWASLRAVLVDQFASSGSVKSSSVHYYSPTNRF